MLKIDLQLDQLYMFYKEWSVTWVCDKTISVKEWSATRHGMDGH